MDCVTGHLCYIATWQPLAREITLVGPLVTTGVLEGFLKGDRYHYDDGSVRNLLQSTVAAVARDITLVTLRNLITEYNCSRKNKQ